MRPTARVAATLVVLAALAVRLPAPPAGAADGELRLAGPVSGLESLDPALAGDAESAAVLRQVHRGLVGFDDRLRPVPELAESVTGSADGLSYDVVLRPGAVFHDGSPVEAEDVAFSLRRALDPDTAGGDLSGLGGPTFLSAILGADRVMSGAVDELEGVRVDGPGRLTITLAAPQATFPMRLASLPASILDREQLAGDAAWAERPNGAGPYRVEDFAAGESLSLVAHGGFVAGPPATERVSIRLGASALQPFNLFQSGQVDLAPVSPFEAPAARARAGELGASLVETPAFSLTYLAFRTDAPPLDDVHVRRAVALAFPRDRIAEVTLEGEATAADGIVPDGMLGRAWPGDVPEADLDAARLELAASRYGDPAAVPTLRLDVSGGYAAEAFRVAVEEGLGVDVEVVDHDPASFFAGLADGDYAAHELTWVADFPDPSTFLESLFATGSAANYLGFSDPEVDRLLREANASPDLDARAALYAEAQARILDSAAVVPLFHGTQHTLVRDGVDGVTVTPMGLLRLETVSVDG